MWLWLIRKLTRPTRDLLARVWILHLPVSQDSLGCCQKTATAPNPPLPIIKCQRKGSRVCLYQRCGLAQRWTVIGYILRNIVIMKRNLHSHTFPWSYVWTSIHASGMICSGDCMCICQLCINFERNTVKCGFILLQFHKHLSLPPRCNISFVFWLRCM